MKPSILFVLASCSLFACDPGPPKIRHDQEPAEAQPTYTPQSPHITEITVPDWPPLGKEGVIEVHCSDDLGLKSISASFHQVYSQSIYGRDRTVSFTGRQLGEGFGTLTLSVQDEERLASDRVVESLLVDLTPPTVAAERLIASPRAEGVFGDISFWVGDAWILGKVEISFRGKNLRHEFPRAYPQNLGKEWDYSRVGFRASELPQGSAAAIVIVTDAAGNSLTKPFDVVVDGNAPTVTISEPALSQDRHARFTFSTKDQEALGATTEIYAGGALVATFADPNGTVDLDLSHFNSGELEIRAIATDQAGNQSGPAVRFVTVP